MNKWRGGFYTNYLVKRERKREYVVCERESES